MDNLRVGSPTVKVLLTNLPGPARSSKFKARIAILSGHLTEPELDPTPNKLDRIEW